jgi:hypothetical protein
MRFDGGLKVVVHPDMKLTRSNLEPATATRAKGGWFFDLLKPQQPAKESARFSLAAFGRG